MKNSRSLQHFLLLSLLPAFFLNGCKKKDPKAEIRKKLERKAKWAHPKCAAFCKKAQNICGDYLKKKKRKLELSSCTAKCIERFLKSTYAISKRLHCAIKAKTCEQLRSCNRCGNIVCPKEEPKKKDPKKQKNNKEEKTHPKGENKNPAIGEKKASQKGNTKTPPTVKKIQIPPKNQKKNSK